MLCGSFFVRRGRQGPARRPGPGARSVADFYNFGLTSGPPCPAAGHDPWEDPILTWITRQSAYKHPSAEDGIFCLIRTPDGDNEWRISSSCLLNTVLVMPIERQTDAAAKRLTKVMEALGWQRPDKPIRIGKRTCRAFTFVEPRDASGPKWGDVLACHTCHSEKSNHFLTRSENVCIFIFTVFFHHYPDHQYYSSEIYPLF